MALHLIKLCVGVDTVAELERGIAERVRHRRLAGEAIEQVHVTRTTPKRASEVMDGGSLFWVIRGQVTVRQPIVDIRPFVGEDGIARCQLVLDPTTVAVESRPVKRFQGWRYLDHGTQPRDLDANGADLPEPLRYALRELCLI